METSAMSCECETQTAIARILVADDQSHVLDALQLLLDGQGYEIDFATSPAGVLDMVRMQRFDAIVMDLNYTRDTTGGAEGLDLVSCIRSIDDTLPMVVMTAWSSVDLAVQAMRRGASDFVQKPWNNRELLGKVREQVDRGRVLRHSQRWREEESREAIKIQENLMPHAIPQAAGYDISAITRPMHLLGGDYYNIVSISDSQTAFCIADVAGKGLPGALLMSNLQAALKPLIREDMQPYEVCTRLNRILCDVMPDNKFISLFYGVLDSQRNRLTYCNAGHNPPLLVRADGSSRELKSSGVILGQFPNWQYTQMDLGLNSGDTLLLFTDGLVEACDPHNEPFGEQRLLQILREPSSDATALKSALLKAVSEHCREQFQDDVTMIVLRATAVPLN